MPRNEHLESIIPRIQAQKAVRTGTGCAGIGTSCDLPRISLSNDRKPHDQLNELPIRSSVSRQRPAPAILVRAMTEGLTWAHSACE
jgi:hypothetical protein